MSFKYRIILSAYFNCERSSDSNRLARESMNDYLEKQLGVTDIPLSDQPTMLDVKIPDALPEAFEKVLHYIYTDRIDCKLIKSTHRGN